jgi:hypothetical protein
VGAGDEEPVAPPDALASAGEPPGSGLKKITRLNRGK